MADPYRDVEWILNNSPSRPEATGAPTSSDSGGLWAARAALAFYVLALLALWWAGQGTGVETESSPWSIRRPAVLLGELLGRVALECARFLPVGGLSILAFRRRPAWPGGILLALLPALVLALLLATLVRILEIGQPFGWPGLLALGAPWLGCLCGAWIASNWRRGPRARWLIIPKLALGLAVILGGFALALVLAAESKPLDFEPERVTQGEKRRLQEVFRGKAPGSLLEGQTHGLRLSEQQLDQLLSWGLGLAGERRKVRLEVTAGRMTLLASLGWPSSGSKRRFWNLTVSGRVAIDEGNVTLRPERMSVGPIGIPRVLLGWAAPVLQNAVLSSRRLKEMLAPVRTLRLEDGAAEIKYGPAKLRPGFVRDLFQEQESASGLVASVRDHVRQLAAAAVHLPRGDARFGAALVTAFTFARQRSGRGDAVSENGAAILALGMLVAHSNLEALVGEVTDDATRVAGVKAYRETTLRGRTEWARHFLLSASASVLTAAGRTDAEDVLAEELDSGGGFSFGNLMARRAGEMFALAATRDEQNARAMQGRLTGGFLVDDFFPEAGDLPEGLSAARLEAKYGGVGGARYRETVAEIERRIAGCAAYQ